MNCNPMTFLLIVVAYLVGAIPTGFLIGKVNGISDIRRHGSGNIGATNIGRSLGFRFFFLVLFIDALKSYLCLYAFSFLALSYNDIMFASAALLLGNAYSIFLGGDGGKGVATLVGIVGALSSYLALVICLIWGVVILVTRTAFLASLISVAALSVGVWYLHAKLFFSSVCAFVFIVWRHRKNIYSALS